ncbi:MAG: carbohydrate porin [Polyangia bacterium]
MIETLLIITAVVIIFTAGLLVGAHNPVKVEGRLAALEADLEAAKTDAAQAHDRIDKLLAGAKVIVQTVSSDAKTIEGKL